LAEGNHPGARSVSRWREEYLRDWQRRMDRLNDTAAAVGCRDAASAVNGLGFPPGPRAVLR